MNGDAGLLPVSLPSLRLVAAITASGLALLTARHVLTNLRNWWVLKKQLPSPKTPFWGSFDLLRDQNHMVHELASVAEELGGMVVIRVLHLPVSWIELNAATSRQLAEGD
jgi:hypothetical protein